MIAPPRTGCCESFSASVQCILECKCATTGTATIMTQTLNKQSEYLLIHLVVQCIRSNHCWLVRTHSLLSPQSALLSAPQRSPALLTRSEKQSEQSAVTASQMINGFMKPCPFGLKRSNRVASPSTLPRLSSSSSLLSFCSRLATERYR
jgi:hypothetical protein